MSEPFTLDMSKEDRANEIIRTGGIVNIPDPHHPDKRIVGWRVDPELAGLSDALFAMDVIAERARRATKARPNKIKVRIPVIVTADGKWAAHGSHWPGEPDWFWIEETCDREKHTICPQRMFIVAELPMPEIKQINAEVIETAETAS
jgi:hypothetical protein